MDINTNTTIQISVSFDEAEARQLLVDARPFQAQVRRQLQIAHSSGRRNGKTIPVPKTLARRGKFGARRSGTKHSSKVPCKICGKSLAPNSVPGHMRRRHPDGAGAGTGSA